MNIRYLQNEIEAIESFHEKTLAYALKRGDFFSAVKLYFIGRRIKKARSNLKKLGEMSADLSKLERIRRKYK